MNPEGIKCGAVCPMAAIRRRMKRHMGSVDFALRPFFAAWTFCNSEKPRGCRFHLMLKNESGGLINVKENIGQLVNQCFYR